MKLHQQIKFILPVFLLFLSAFSQRSEIRFRNFDIDDGLSQSTVETILQDDRGFLWFGTETGINKFDGYTFRIYAHEPGNNNSLGNDLIYKIISDKNGIFWIGTARGLTRFDPTLNSYTRYYHAPDKPASLSDNRITTLLQVRSGLIWVGTENGISICDPAQDKNGVSFTRLHSKKTEKNSLSHNVVRALYQDSQGIIWIGTEGGGLDRYDPKTEKFSHFTHSPDLPGCISSNRITCIYEDRKGTLWVGTDDSGLNRFNRLKRSFTWYKHSPDNVLSIGDNSINVLYEDSVGTFWIGTNNQGVNIFNRDRNKFYRYINSADDPFSLPSNRILDIFEDRDGGVWIGTSFGGVSYYNRYAQKFNHYKHDPDNPKSLSNNTIWAICEARDSTIWISTDFGGINRWNEKEGTFTHFKHDPRDKESLSDNSVYIVCEDSSGEFWAGTRAGGLNRFNPETGKFKHYLHDEKDPHSISHNKVPVLLIDSKKNLWAGTFGGLNRYDRKRDRFIRYIHDPDSPGSIAGDKFLALLEDRSGTLWVGSYGSGLNKYDSQKDSFTRYQSDSTDTNSLIGNFILSLRQDCLGNIWIGTNTGLSGFNRDTETFTNYTTKNGLPDNVIYDIIEDNSCFLWLSTNKGLARFNPRTEEFRIYDVKDGLQSNEFNTHSGCIRRNGEVLFGGINGFNVFYPDRIRDNSNIPQVAITDLQLFNEPVPIGRMADGRTILQRSIEKTSAIKLSYRDNVFSFEFAALHFAAPENNRYAYMMVGLEKEWNYIGSRRNVTYSSLPPGKYIFRAKASNNIGTWNEKGTSLAITIVPPFWRTGWFYTAVLIILIWIATAAYRSHVSGLQRRKEEDERRKVTADFSHLLEESAAVVYRRNFKSDTYEYIGEGIKYITGYAPSEFNLNTWDTIVLRTQSTGQLANHSLEEIIEQVQTGLLNRWQIDFQIRTKAGDIKWVRDITTALHDDKGKCYACLGIIFDITDRKMAEQKLSNTTLELKKSSTDLKARNREMEQDLNMAREIQTSLLKDRHYFFPEDSPEEESVLQFNHRYLPASKLAGDFFEIFPVSAHEVGVLICDVMGHGTRASLITFYLRGLIEQLMPFSTEPGTFITKLNQGFTSISERFESTIFATLFYYVFDIRTFTLKFANAGHPVPFVIQRSENSITHLTADGSRPQHAIGIYENTDFTTHEVSISPDDSVFLFTDGLFEFIDTDEEIYGQERLFSAVSSRVTDSPSELIENLFAEVRSCAKHDEFNDDVCMVTMHVQKTAGSKDGIAQNPTQQASS